ncbi:budding uninhibited by benzimidazole- protein [Perkinsus chesapeaki]|uniref:Budding uninhibited by benzimidazole- protein n=1 Tax=Perkinsus chesapeaki TaxID=330153 RepID=A0A7J6MTK4_PERCH|nr:budding uninhibited by benzimidazole- protein [Perkinsus chesapeaki]
MSSLIPKRAPAETAKNFLFLRCNLENNNKSIGDKYEMTVPEFVQALSTSERYDKERLVKWFRLLKDGDFTESYNSDPNGFRGLLARIGAPPRFRALCWRAVVGWRDQLRPGTYEKLCIGLRGDKVAWSTTRGDVSGGTVTPPGKTARQRAATEEGLDSPSCSRQAPHEASSPSIASSHTNLAVYPSIAAELHRDLRRTFPGSEYFNKESNLDALGRVIYTFAASNAHVGYCQGMNFISGMLLQVTHSEDDTFWLLCLLMHRFNLAPLFTVDRALLALMKFMFGRLLETQLPHLTEHFSKVSEAEGITLDVTDMYATKWFMTLFAYSLPITTVLRLWDFLFAACPPLPPHLGFPRGLLLLSLAIMSLSSKRFLREKTFAGIQMVLNDIGGTSSHSAGGHDSFDEFGGNFSPPATIRKKKLLQIHKYTIGSSGWGTALCDISPPVPWRTPPTTRRPSTPGRGLDPELIIRHALLLDAKIPQSILEELRKEWAAECPDLGAIMDKGDLAAASQSVTTVVNLNILDCLPSPTASDVPAPPQAAGEEENEVKARVWEPVQDGNAFLNSEQQCTALLSMDQLPKEEEPEPQLSAEEDHTQSPSEDLQRPSSSPRYLTKRAAKQKRGNATSSISLRDGQFIRVMSMEHTMALRGRTPERSMVPMADRSHSCGPSLGSSRKRQASSNSRHQRSLSGSCTFAYWHPPPRRTDTPPPEGPY